MGNLFSTPETKPNDVDFLKNIKGLFPLPFNTDGASTLDSLNLSAEFVVPMQKRYEEYRNKLQQDMIARKVIPQTAGSPVSDLDWNSSPEPEMPEVPEAQIGGDDMTSEDNLNELDEIEPSPTSVEETQIGGCVYSATSVTPKQECNGCTISLEQNGGCCGMPPVGGACAREKSESSVVDIMPFSSTSLGSDYAMKKEHRYD